jgi:hypothetical protein
MKEILQDGNMSLEVEYDNEITTAVVRSDINGRNIIGRAHAKWNPADRYNGETGKSLAFLRALQRWSRKAEKSIIRTLDAK